MQLATHPRPAEQGAASAGRFVSTICELTDIAMQVALIAGRRAVAQAEELAASAGPAAPASVAPAPVAIRPASAAPVGPPAEPAAQHPSAKSRLPAPPTLPRRIDWMTLFVRVSAEVRRLIGLEAEAGPHGAPASESLRPERLRSLLRDAAAAEPAIADLDAKLARLERLLTDEPPPGASSGEGLCIRLPPGPPKPAERPVPPWDPAWAPRVAEPLGPTRRWRRLRSRGPPLPA